MLVVLLVALLSGSIDALTKAWAQAALPSVGIVPVVGDFLRLKLGYNTGIAFGFLAGGGWPLCVLVSGSILVLVAWLLGSVKKGLPYMRALQLGMILGGGVANLADRVADGRVTDFIDVGLAATRWPTFNTADSFIVLGILALLWGAFATRERTDSAELGAPGSDK